MTRTTEQWLLELLTEQSAILAKLTSEGRHYDRSLGGLYSTLLAIGEDLANEEVERAEARQHPEHIRRATAERDAISAAMDLLDWARRRGSFEKALKELLESRAWALEG